MINNVQLLAARSGVMVRVVSAIGPAVLGAGITKRRDITRSLAQPYTVSPNLAVRATARAWAVIARR